MPETSIEYWSSTPSTVDGMLGGFPQVSRIDISGSRTFLVKLLRTSNPCPSPLPSPHKVRLVADTGAGIGRVTINLLASIAQHVDIIEPIPKFTEQLRADHPSLFAGSDPVVQKIVNSGLESWHPLERDAARRYDVVWSQWCLGHLTDSALISYLRRLIPALSPNGWIVVKENVLGNGSDRAAPSASATAKRKREQHSDVHAQHTSPDADPEVSDDGEPDLYDPVDSSVTRTPQKFARIFHAAGLKVVKTELQRGFGKDLGLYPVRMWGLQPTEGWTDKAV